MIEVPDKERTAEPAGQNRRLLSATGLFIALDTIASALTYGSNLIFGRILPSSSYGELTALLALVTIITIPTGAAQTIVAERLASLMAEGNRPRVRYLIRYAASHVLTISVGAGILYAIAIPLVVDVFHIADIGPALATLPLLITSFFIPFCNGVLQGLDRFLALGLMLLLSAASRIVLGVPWTLLFHGGAGGALFGQALGNSLVGLATIWIVRDLHLPRGTGAARSGLRRRIDRRAVDASLAFIAFAILTNLDVLLAKALLKPTDAGYYAAMLTIEKLILFLPSAVAVVMVPNAARAQLGENNAAKILRIASLVVLVAAVVAVIPAGLAPRFVIVTMFGHSYAAASPGVLPIAIAGAGFALINLLITYTVTIGYRPTTYLLLAAVPCQATAISIFHHSATQVATVQACVVIGILCVNEVAFNPMFRPRRATMP